MTTFNGSNAGETLNGSTSDDVINALADPCRKIRTLFEWI